MELTLRETLPRVTPCIDARSAASQLTCGVGFPWRQQMSLTEFEVWTARGRRPKVKAGRISSSPFSGDDGRRSTGFLGVSSAPQICTEFIEKSFFQGIKDSTRICKLTRYPSVRLSSPTTAYSTAKGSSRRPEKENLFS